MSREPQTVGNPGVDRTTPCKFGSQGLILLNSGDGLVRDLGNRLRTPVLLYGLGINFDSSEKIYTLIYTII